MHWEKKFSLEQQVARQVLLTAAKVSSSSLSTFTGWFLAVSGASFSFVVAHIDVVSTHVRECHTVWAFAIFALSLLLGLVSQFIGVSVLAAIAAFLEVEQQIKSSGSDAKLNSLAITKIITDAFLPIYRCIGWRSYKKTKHGNAMYPIQSIVHLSQYQALLVVAQLLLICLSVLVLSLGIIA